MDLNMSYAALSAVANAANAGIRRSEVNGLPKGWVREEIPRFAYGGGGKGGVEVVYYTPKGHRIRTKNEMAKALGDNYDLTAFDFQTGKINHALLQSVMQKAAQAQAAAAQAAKLAQQQQTHYRSSSSSSHQQNNHHGRKGSSSNNHNNSSSRNNGHHHAAATHNNSNVVVNGRGSSHSAAKVTPPPVVVPPPPKPDPTLIPPIRQTASIFKQPVTVEKRSRPEGEEGEEGEESAPAKSRPPSDLKSTTSEKPRQLFWEKRLGGGLRASCPEEAYEPWRLPSQLKPVGPPGVSPEDDDDAASPPTMVLASISTSLHLNSGSGAGAGGGKGGSAVGNAVNGQKDAKSMRDKDPSVFCQPDQPLFAATKLSQSDVDKQEARVAATRKKLAEAMAALQG